MNMDTILYELRKSIQRMDRQGFEDLIATLEVIYTKTHPFTSQKDSEE